MWTPKYGDRVWVQPDWSNVPLVGTVYSRVQNPREDIFSVAYDPNPDQGVVGEEWDFFSREDLQRIRGRARDTAPVLRLIGVLERRVLRETERGRDAKWTLRVAYAYLHCAYQYATPKAGASWLLQALLPLSDWLTDIVLREPLEKERKARFVHASLLALRSVALFQV
jgi:hypothetical protein